MTVSSLSDESLNKIRAHQRDRIIEKHEGPEDWDFVMDHYDPEFLTIFGCSVLLPIKQNQYPNITILRSIVSEDGSSLSIFLKDTAYYPDAVDALFWTSRMAACDRIAGEDFFIAILYHDGWSSPEAEASRQD